MDNLSFDRIIQVVQQHKCNLNEILDKHKMLPKRKVQMISMHVVHPAFNIDVLKLEHAFQIGYCKGDKVFYVSPLNWKGKEEFFDFYVDFWNAH